MHSSDEEQRQLHEEILTLRQQLGQEAAAIIPSSVTETKSKRRSTGEGEHAATQGRDSVSGNGAAVDDSVPRIIEMTTPGSKSTEPSRQLNLHAADGTRYVVTAPDVVPGTSVRLVIPSTAQGQGQQQINQLATDHVGGQHAHASETESSAILGIGDTGHADTHNGKSHVDEELSETAALVAKMRRELGLASDSTGGLADISVSGSG